MTLAVVAYQGHTLFSFRRSFLPDTDARAVRAYLAANDQADFVASNIMADGHVQAYFGRHFFRVADDPRPQGCRDFYRWMFSQLSVDTFHAVFFTEPESRFIDKSLWPLMANDGQWAALGDPFHHQAEAYGAIWGYDDRIRACFDEVHADVKAQYGQMTIYAIHREQVMAPPTYPSEVALRIDYGEPSSDPYKLRGFSERLRTPEGEGFAWARGYTGCDGPGSCRTVLTKREVEFRGPPMTHQGLTALVLPATCGYSAKVRVFSALEGQHLRVVVNGHDVAAFPPAPAFDQRDLAFRMAPSVLRQDGVQLVGVDFEKRREDWGVGLAMMNMVVTPDPDCPKELTAPQ